MRKRYITLVTLLIIGHLLTELHTIMMWIDPSLEKYYVGGWFIQPKFFKKDLSILWYSKMVEDSLLLCILLFSGACQAYSSNYKTYLEWQRYSIRLYTIWVIYFMYHCFDMFSFLYNYKTCYWLYVVVLSICTISASLIGFYKVKRFVEN